MNVLASECSSGCESGWTLYLEQSFLSQNPSGPRNGFCEDEFRGKRCSNEDGEDDEEDQSMVSDASSGPPHFNDDEVYFDENNNGCFYPPSRDVRTLKFGGKKQKLKEKSRSGVQEQQQHSFLDDTASSPFFNISKNNFIVSNNQASGDSVLDYSQGFSSTHLQGRSAYQEHYSFLQSTLPGNQLQDQNQWFEEKGMGMR